MNYDDWLERPYQEWYRAQEMEEQRMHEEISWRHEQEMRHITAVTVAVADRMFSDYCGETTCGELLKAYAKHRDNPEKLGKAVATLLDNRMLDCIHFQLTGGKPRS
jgi:hypothetical protein